MRPSRNVSTDQTKRWNWAKNPEDPSGVPAMLAKPRTTPISPETTHVMPAATPWGPGPTAEARSGIATAARKNSPTVRAANRSWTVRMIGNPHRTTAPGPVIREQREDGRPSNPDDDKARRERDHSLGREQPEPTAGGRLSEAAVDMTPP